MFIRFINDHQIFNNYVILNTSFVFTLSNDYYIIGVESSETPGNALIDKNLKNIIIPTSHEGKFVREVGDRAFQHTNIISAFIPFSIRVLRRGCFNSCGLRKIIFEKNSQLTSIGEAAFVNNRKLTLIDIPSSVTLINTKQEPLFKRSGIKCISFLGTTDLSSAYLFTIPLEESIKAYVLPTHAAKLGNIDAIQMNKECRNELRQRTCDYKRHAIDHFKPSLLLVMICFSSYLLF